ncbi:hypothetical protein [Streptomyces chartreusis]|uniref:hypothetical protein n=1 Tax=Streptomyces chartreusis TaxID=1969 RepID=UPI003627DCD1
MRRLDPTDPPTIGGYPLLARLGAGGMGQVFLSRTASGRPLALKTVRARTGFGPATGLGPAAGFGPPTAYGSAIAYGPPPAVPPSLAPGPVPLASDGAGSTTGRPSAPAWAAAAVAGAVMAGAVVTALAWSEGTDDATGGNGRRSPPISTSPSPTTAGNALSGSWVGTWKGTGPGSPAGNGIVNARTSKVTVTVTLHAADRGVIVGRQVSHVTGDGWAGTSGAPRR